MIPERSLGRKTEYLANRGLFSQLLAYPAITQHEPSSIHSTNINVNNKS